MFKGIEGIDHDMDIGLGGWAVTCGQSANQKEWRSGHWASEVNQHLFWGVLERQMVHCTPIFGSFMFFLKWLLQIIKHWSSERTDRLTTRVFFWWCYAA